MSRKVMKRFIRLYRALKPHGLYIRNCRSGHLGIYKVDTGERVYVCANSPSVPIEYAEHNTISALQKMGYVPEYVNINERRTYGLRRTDDESRVAGKA